MLRRGLTAPTWSGAGDPDGGAGTSVCGAAVMGCGSPWSSCLNSVTVTKTARHCETGPAQSRTPCRSVGGARQWSVTTLCSSPTVTSRVDDIACVVVPVSSPVQVTRHT